MIIMISKSVHGKERNKSGAKNGQNVTEKKGRGKGKEKMIEEGTGTIDQIEGTKIPDQCLRGSCCITNSTQNVFKMSHSPLRFRKE